VLLLLAALNELSVWVGQTIFAVSIVLLWCQTPSIPEAREAEAETDTRSPAGGFALIAVIILACLQGWAWQRGGIDLFPAGLTVFSIGLAICLVASAMRGGVGGLRLAGAVAIMGPLLGIGILSLGRMLPVAWELSRASAQAPADPPPLYLAFGIGRYALEIALLLGFAGLVGLLPAFAARTTKWIGLGLAAIAFAMIISRIAGWF